MTEKSKDDEDYPWIAATTDEMYWKDAEGWWTHLESIGEWYPNLDGDVDDWIKANPEVGIVVFRDGP